MKPPIASYLLPAPALLMLSIVITGPAVYVFYLSFTESSFGTATTMVGAANFARILRDGYFWTAFLNTFLVVNVIVYGELLLALGIAVLFAGGVPCRKIMFSIMLMPYATSQVVAVIVWRYMLEPDVGILTQVLANLGLPALEWTVNRWHGLTIVSLVSIWLHLPFTFIILYSALISVPRELHEAAHVDGATGWQTFRYVVMPYILPAVLVAMMFRFVFAFRMFAEVWLLTGGGPIRMTEVLATYLYREAFRYHNFGVASATGWLLLVATLIIASFYLLQMYRRTLKSDA